MRRIYVDGDLPVEDTQVEFCYTSVEGGFNTVLVDAKTEYVQLSERNYDFPVAVGDIPKLIEALKAAYAYHKEANK